MVEDILEESFPVESGQVIVPQSPGLRNRPDLDKIAHYAVNHGDGGHA